jgi:type VI secretion system protein ImpE
MDAQEHLRAGDLEKALSALQGEVRSKPADARKRTFLFQLLAVMGRWDRALDQLNVAGELDASTLAMVHTYRPAIASEWLRLEIFAGRSHPVVFGEPERWIALLTEALQQDAAGEAAVARVTRDQAFEEAPPTTGSLNGDPFGWIADCDSRLGPVLEVVTGGNLYWIPFHRIRRIEVEPPEDLRDMVWLPAHFTWSNGGEGVGLIPTRYPGTENSGDTALCLARKTDWVDTPGGGVEGLGQRMLATDRGEFPMLEVRDIQLDVAGS